MRFKKQTDNDDPNPRLMGVGVNHGKLLYEKRTGEGGIIFTEQHYADGHVSTNVVYLGVDSPHYQDGTYYEKKSPDYSEDKSTLEGNTMNVQLDFSGFDDESQEHDLHPDLVGDFEYPEPEYEWPELPKFEVEFEYKERSLFYEEIKKPNFARAKARRRNGSA